MNRPILWTTRLPVEHSRGEPIYWCWTLWHGNGFCALATECYRKSDEWGCSRLGAKVAA